MPFPLLIPAFFFSAWLLMIFWGMVSPGVGVPTIGYPTAMLATIGLWLVVFPLRASGQKSGAKFMAMGAAGRGRRPRGPGKRPDGSWQTAEQDVVNISSSFAGRSQRITSQNFAGGSVNANLGGVQLDLTQAALSGNSARLNVRAFLGGIELYVPEEWDVEFDVSAFMGGVTDERSRPGSRAAGSPRLVLSGSATLGGVTVKDE